MMEMPTISTILEAISKACDLPDRDEKWALLRTLTDIVMLSAYPTMVVGGFTDNVSVTLNGQGFVITREAIEDNIDEAQLLAQYRRLKAQVAKIAERKAS